MALFETVEEFTANGFTYLHRTRAGKDIYTSLPADGSMYPRVITKKEFVAIKKAELALANQAEIAATSNAEQFRVLVPQNFPNVAHANAELQNPQGWEQHVRALCSKHGIEVEFHPYKDLNRFAYVEERRIVTPKITSVYTFCIALHEIAHVVLGLHKKTSKVLDAEYHCEMWSLREALTFGCSTEEMLHVRMEARKYIRLHYTKIARLKGFKPEKVPTNIWIFTEINPHSMKGAHILYDRFDDTLIIHQEVEECEKYTQILIGEEFENPDFFVKKCLACGRVYMQPKDSSLSLAL